MVFLNVNEKTAIHLYWKLVGDNKTFYMIVGYLILFALFFYVALSQMTKYLDQIDHGIENIISESTDPIHLITELKPIEIRLNEIKATLKRQELEATEGEKKKNDLVLFLAHDLKTPLTSIVAYLTMLEDHPDMPEEEREAYTHIALEKSIRLGELINEFFDITRYNLQNIELEPVEIDLTMMLEQLADELYGVLQEKKLTCEVDVEEDLMIYGDPDKLARVFDNILRNAIAYCYANTEIRIEAKIKDGISRSHLPMQEIRFRVICFRQYSKNSTVWMVPDQREPAAQVSDLQSPNRLWSCMGAEFWQKVMTIRRSLS